MEKKERFFNRKPSVPAPDQVLAGEEGLESPAEAAEEPEAPDAPAPAAEAPVPEPAPVPPCRRSSGSRRWAR